MCVLFDVVCVIVCDCVVGLSVFDGVSVVCVRKYFCVCVCGFDGGVSVMM